LAATDQSRVKNLVIIAPFGLYRNDLRIPDIFALLPHEVNRLLVLDENSPTAKALRAVPEGIEEQLEDTIHKIQTKQAAAKFLWPIPDKGLDRRIQRIKSPTLIVWGRQDALIPVEYAEDFHRNISNSQVRIINQASHLVQLEQTSEVIAAIREFIPGYSQRSVC